MEAIDEAISLDSFDQELYIMRAKIAAVQGDHPLAHSDLNDASLLGEGYMSWEGWETLAFVFVNSGDFEEAAELYDNLFNDGLESPHVLVGAGIAYAELYGDAAALRLLEEGMQAAVDYGFEGDPQLVVLYEMAEELQDKKTK